MHDTGNCSHNRTLLSIGHKMTLELIRCMADGLKYYPFKMLSVAITSHTWNVVTPPVLLSFKFHVFSFFKCPPLIPNQ